MWDECRVMQVAVIIIHILHIIHYLISIYGWIIDILIMIGNMYLTPNDWAMYLYGGMMGAFLSSGSASEFNLDNHPWHELQKGIEWLHNNNPIFQIFFTLSNPRSHYYINDMNLTNEHSSNFDQAGKYHLASLLIYI